MTIKRTQQDSESIFLEYSIINQGKINNGIQPIFSRGDLLISLNKAANNLLIIFSYIEAEMDFENCFSCKKTELSKTTGISRGRIDIALNILHKCNIITITSMPNQTLTLYLNPNISWKGKKTDIGKCPCRGFYYLPISKNN